MLSHTGPSKLPELGKGLGKTVKSFQTAAKVRGGGRGARGHRDECGGWCGDQQVTLLQQFLHWQANVLRRLVSQTNLMPTVPANAELHSESLLLCAACLINCRSLRRS